MYNPPKAYFITFTTYGTRLHGDDRGTVDRFHSQPSTPFVEPSFKLLTIRRQLLKESPLILDAEQRGVVDESIRQHCDYRKWLLYTRNVRTNHVHIVVPAALDDPEQMMVQFKAYATRSLRAEGLIGSRKRVWTEGGSKRWLFTDEAVKAACEYVTHGQGPDLEMR